MRDSLPSPRGEALVRALGVRPLAANVVNNTIGSGIFVLPALIASLLGPAAVLAYVICAIAAALIASCFAEVGSRVSATGGSYAYVEAAFGPWVGFLVGALFWFGSAMISSAAVGVMFVTSLGALVPALAGPAPRAALLVLLFAGLAVLNVRGVRTGARLVEIVTAAKIAPFVVLIALGFFAVNVRNLAWTGVPSVGDLGRASLILIFAFFGMEGALTSSGEVRDPSRTVPRAILLGLGVATLLYAGVHFTAQGVLGADLARDTAAPLAATAERMFGRAGSVLMLLAAMVSAFGLVSGDILATSRILFAFGRDGLVPSALARVHPRYRTPHVAIATHAAVCCAFALTGTFTALVVLSVVATLLIYLAIALSALQLRRRDVRLETPPYRAPGGPLVPLLACAVVAWMLASASLREFAAVGVVLLVASVLYRVRRIAVVPAPLPATGEA